MFQKAKDLFVVRGVKRVEPKGYRISSSPLKINERQPFANLCNNRCYFNKLQPRSLVNNPFDPVTVTLATSCSFCSPKRTISMEVEAPGK